MQDRHLNDQQLEQSDVVANCRMNRERNLTGTNSYEADLGFSPLNELTARETETDSPSWLDVCCGSGRALIQAGQHCLDVPELHAFGCVGVDLVDFFDPLPNTLEGTVQFVTGSIFSWEPDSLFDLITCVHGVHYLGDKVGFLAKAAGWLKPQGKFAAHLDLNSIHFDKGSDNRRVLRWLREAGFEYNRHRHLVTRTGPADVSFPVEYLGADDQTGPNYTGQPAVTSYYRLQSEA